MKKGPLLEEKYFFYLLNFVGVKVNNRLKISRKKLDEERRNHLRKKDEEAYSKCVLQFSELKLATFNELTKEVSDCLGIPVQDFNMSLE